MINLYLLLGSIVGFVGGLVLSAVGLHLGDRWLVLAGLVGTLAFGGAVFFFGSAV